MRLGFVVGLVLVTSLSLCGSGCGTEEIGGEADAMPGAGSERGACYGNDTCNEGLQCLSGLCVRLPETGAEPAVATPTEATPSLAPEPAPAAPRATMASSASAQTGHPTFVAPFWPGDSVDEDRLTSAGWKCGSNEVGNHECSYQPTQGGKATWTIQYMVDDGRVSRIGLSGGRLGDAASARRELIRQMAELGAGHGWTCAGDGDWKDFTCTRGQRFFQGVSSPADRGYAAVYVNDDVERIDEGIE